MYRLRRSILTHDEARGEVEDEDDDESMKRAIASIERHGHNFVVEMAVQHEKAKKAGEYIVPK